MSKKEIDPQLKKYVQDNIISQYKGFETSHNDEHIKTVIENSFDIVEELQLDVDPDMVYVIAAYHDIGIPLGRDRHHITSAEIMFKDKNLDRWFSEEEKKTIKEAIEDHRASNSLPPRSIYGKIVAEADRDIEPLRIVKRCVQYETAVHPLATKAEISSHIKNHLNEKYGEEGYLKLWLSTKKNWTGLDVQKKIFIDRVYELLKIKPDYEQYLYDIKLAILNEYVEFVEADEDEDGWYLKHAEKLATEIDDYQR